MNTRDPKLVVLLFNERINCRDARGLSALMAEDHTLVVRDGTVVVGRDANARGWTQFFDAFPDYRNTFDRIESGGDTVVVIGHAFWSAEEPHDPVIWTARIEGDRVAEWRIHDDTPEARERLGIAAG